MQFKPRFPTLLKISSAILVLGLAVLQAQQPPPTITPDIQLAMAQISPDSLRGHLSFIASDSLAGRNTPSTGLDIAAEYIAAQFRRMGLTPLGDDGYFQTAEWQTWEFERKNFSLRIQTNDGSIQIDPNQVSPLRVLNKEIDISQAAMIKLDYRDTNITNNLKIDETEGKIIITDFAEKPPENASPEIAKSFFTMSRILMFNPRPALIIFLDRQSTTNPIEHQSSTLIPQDEQESNGRRNSGPLRLVVRDAQLIKLYDEMRSGQKAYTLSLHSSLPRKRAVKLRNVAGLLPGSDPQLKNSYLIVSAHYDHIGISPIGGEDRISNGANDNGSGTVSLIEMASALANLKEKPKRSILFITFFGEEKGILGSRYYCQHPLIPLEKTIANINLEQLGRTDSTEGAQLATASLTGFDYTDLSSTFLTAGKVTGINVYKHATNSDNYFAASDNIAFALAGIPAHTICVAFNYPDYHQTGDHWQKIDYENMAKIDRMITLSIFMLASNANTPQWNEKLPQTAKYLQAWQELHNKK